MAHRKVGREKEWVATHIAKGYILLARELANSSLWQLSPDHLRLAVYLLLKARHKSKSHVLADGTTINRGELVTSMALIAEECSYHDNRKVHTWSRQKVVRLLQGLENVGFIKRNSDSNGTLLHICNYWRYQQSDNYKSDSSETVATTNNNGNNEKNDVDGADGGFPSLLTRLRDNPTLQNAIAAIRASHKSFRDVSEFHITNVLNTQPNRDTWADCIAGMASSFAGASMDRPILALKKWIKPQATRQPDHTPTENELLGIDV